MCRICNTARDLVTFLFISILGTVLIIVAILSPPEQNKTNLANQRQRESENSDIPKQEDFSGKNLDSPSNTDSQKIDKIPPSFKAKKKLAPIIYVRWEDRIKAEYLTGKYRTIFLGSDGLPHNQTLETEDGTWLLDGKSKRRIK